MTDPERWLTDRRLELPVLASLEAARDFEAVPGAKAATWQALRARLPGSPPGGPSGDPGGGPSISDPTAGFSAGGAGLSSLAGASIGMALKALAVGAGIGFLVSGTASVALDWSAPQDPARKVEAPAATEPRTVVEATRASAEPVLESARTAKSAPRSLPLRVAAPESTELTTTRARRVASSPATARFSEPSARPSAAVASAQVASAQVASPGRALDESRLTAAAHQALRSGDTRQALVLLDRAARNFPNGLLAQEREALLIEALHRSGERRAAERRGRRFVAANPTSPHVARVRELLDE